MNPLEPQLKLSRTAVRGPAGKTAIFTNAAFGFEVGMPWFEPRFWLARDALVASHEGRGATTVFDHDGRRFVLRHYQRGGLAARVSADRYLWLGESRTRPFQEMQLNLRMQAVGLPVPVPLASRYLQSGATYSADIITEYLPDTETLAMRLDRTEVGLPTWAAIGRCIRRFHDYGLDHVDLNAHNILLRNEVDVFLVDFDRCKRRKPGLWRDANLARLRRSLDALEDNRATRRFDEAQWQCLLAAWF